MVLCAPSQDRARSRDSCSASVRQNKKKSWAQFSREAGRRILWLARAGGRGTVWVSNPRISTWKFGVKTSPSGRAFHCKFGCQLLVGVVRHGYRFEGHVQAQTKSLRKNFTRPSFSQWHGPADTARPCRARGPHPVLYCTMTFPTVQYSMYCTVLRSAVQYHYDTVQKTVLISCRPLNSISNRIGPPQRLHYIIYKTKTPIR
jgi:hypothetical protein